MKKNDDDAKKEAKPTPPIPPKAPPTRLICEDYQVKDKPVIYEQKTTK